MIPRSATSCLGELGGARILVVEDEFIIQLELEALLRDAGATIAGPCRSVASALDIAQHENFTAAILDVRLGRDTVAPVARLLMRRHIPFLFYTGQTDRESVVAEYPDASIIAKPADRAQIVDALVRLIHGRTDSESKCDATDATQ